MNFTHNVKTQSCRAANYLTIIINYIAITNTNTKYKMYCRHYVPISILIKSRYTFFFLLGLNNQLTMPKNV